MLPSNNNKHRQTNRHWRQPSGDCLDGIVCTEGIGHPQGIGHLEGINRKVNSFYAARYVHLTFIMLCLVALAPSTLKALESDRKQPITIDADSAERDEIAGTTTYAGNVQMAQGSMRINADQIIIHNTRDKVTKIVAKGSPATYQQKPNNEEDLVVAKAQTLEYRIDQETLRLLNSASLKQEGTSLSGNRIEYDVRRSVVKAGSNAQQSERVRMVIPPKTLINREQDGERVDGSPSAESDSAPIKSNSTNTDSITTNSINTEAGREPVR